MNAAADSDWCATLTAPFGMLGVRADARAVTHVEFLPHGTPEIAPRSSLAESAVGQIARYLDDPAFPFTLPLAPAGTAFRQQVWAALLRIPVGTSLTYGELARLLRTAARCVGGACGANPIAVVIPCHRVTGSQGALGGFMNSASGDPLAIKRWLLAHEGCRLGG